MRARDRRREAEPGRGVCWAGMVLGDRHTEADAREVSMRDVAIMFVWSELALARRPRFGIVGSTVCSTQ